MGKGVLPDITGGPSSWPLRGIFRSCAIPVNGHDRQYIRNNTITHVHEEGIRWVCGNGATRCDISGNDIALTEGMVTLGRITLTYYTEERCRCRVRSDVEINDLAKA